MLFALATPAAFVVLAISFVSAVVVHASAQAWLSARWGDRAPAAAGRTRLDPRAQLDPFGTIGAAVAGIGYARPVELDPRRFRTTSRFVLTVLVGVVANLALAALGIAAFVLAGGEAGVLALPGLLSSALRDGAPDAFGPAGLLLFGLSQLAVGLLSLVPLPPLDGGRILFALAPRSSGWQKAQHYLVDQNIGIAVVLLLLIIPLAGNRPLLPYLLDVVSHPVLARLPGAA